MNAPDILLSSNREDAGVAQRFAENLQPKRSFAELVGRTKVDPHAAKADF